jgi:hypothetical protein
MKTSFEEKIKTKLSKGETEYSEVADTVTLEYIKMCAIGTDNDVALAKEVRRILGVEKSRKPVIVERHYLPAENEL